MPIKVRKVGNRYRVIYETVKRLGDFDSLDEAWEYVQTLKQAVKDKKRAEK
jgi:hypothetical protein